MKRYDDLIMELLNGNTPKEKYESLLRIKSALENKWPDEVRLKMIEKSEFYAGSEKVYQYGFYDGFQLAIKKATGND